MFSTRPQPAAGEPSGAVASSRFDRTGIVRFYDCLTETASFRDDVLRGLSAVRKALPPKHFYDAEGSRLFEAICELPEYYPTRTEMAIMREHVAEIAGVLHADGARVPLEDVLAAAPLEERIYRFRCVEGWSMVIP